MTELNGTEPVYQYAITSQVRRTDNSGQPGKAGKGRWLRGLCWFATAGRA